MDWRSRIATGEGWREVKGEVDDDWSRPDGLRVTYLDNARCQTFFTSVCIHVFL